MLGVAMPLQSSTKAAAANADPFTEGVKKYFDGQVIVPNNQMPI
jgi:hypothetical protein